jgi:hypothetical protein
MTDERAKEVLKSMLSYKNLSYNEKVAINHIILVADQAEIWRKELIKTDEKIHLFEAAAKIRRALIDKVKAFANTIKPGPAQTGRAYWKALGYQLAQDALNEILEESEAPDHA